MKKYFENITAAFSGKTAFGILLGIGTTIVILLVFSAGLVVGLHIGSFRRLWNENYSQNFGTVQGGAPQGVQYSNPHGASGEIVRVELPTIIVAGEDNVEKIVRIDNRTRIIAGNKPVNPEELKVDDTVVVIGVPDNSGGIKAKFIRVMPAEQSDSGQK